jgi:creatine kinase/arginine kinase
MISDALKRLEGDLKGSYHPLENMDESVKREMIENHFLFKEGDRFLEAAGANRDWPRGRGIYHNEEKSFLVWVNEEDQMRIISMQRGADREAVFSRLSRALKALERELFFAFDERLGYIGSCPTNLGTAMRASVHIRIPKLAEDMQLLQSITDKHHLQIRGTDGEHSLSREGIFDISNRRRLGISEVEAVQGMYDGIVELIETENRI